MINEPPSVTKGIPFRMLNFHMKNDQAFATSYSLI